MTETAREAVARAIVREIGYADQICEFDDAAAVAVVVLAAYHAWLDAHGWQIVPKEPTVPMLDAMEAPAPFNDRMRPQYRRALAAAPKPPGA